MKIYMDVCCLCRPFDDQMNGRIRLEVTAVQEIIRRCAAHEFSLVSSEVIEEELSRIPDTRKRLRVGKIISVANESILIDERIISRMHEQGGIGFQQRGSAGRGGALGSAAVRGGGSQQRMRVREGRPTFQTKSCPNYSLRENPPNFNNNAPLKLFKKR